MVVSSKKKSTSAAARQSKTKKVEFRGYLNRNISAAEKDLYRQELENGWAWYEKAEELISDGYNLKWSWDDYNQAFAATLYDTSSERPHGGYCLSFRGSEPFEAMSRLMWVHYVLLDGDWDNISVVGDDDRW